MIATIPSSRGPAEGHSEVDIKEPNPAPRPWGVRRRWGWVLAVALLVTSLLGDLANALLGVEPCAWLGVPIAAALLGYLATARVRAFFVSGDES